jgi:hypothetical protein
MSELASCQLGKWLLFAEFNTVLRSRSRKEPHLLVGAGAVTLCGSGSDNGIKHG